MPAAPFVVGLRWPSSKTMKAFILLACATFLFSSLWRANATAVSVVLLQPRQQATNTTGPIQGGAASAADAASAAGHSIDTGADGERSTPTSTVEFAQLLSGVFFGGVLTLITGGAFIVQAWHYFERFGRPGSDKLAVQIAVATMVVFSLLQDCVIIHRLYDIHVGRFGDFAFPLLTVGWEISVSWACVAINAGLAQFYYAHRVWLAFNKNRGILIVYALLITFTFCGGFASAAMIIEAGSAANVKGQALHAFQPNSIPWQFSVVFATWLCSIAAVDVSLCLSLIWQLNKMSTPFFHTRHAVARLLLLSVETCLGTTTLSITAMILYLAVPYQFYFQIPFLPIGQVMCCSLVVTLMTRPSIARELARDQVGLPLSGASIEDASSAAPNSLAKPVVKRLMRQERKKRPTGDGTGVRMTMTTQEVTFELPDAISPLRNRIYEADKCILPTKKEENEDGTEKGCESDGSSSCMLANESLGNVDEMTEPTRWNQRQGPISTPLIDHPYREVRPSVEANEQKGQRTASTTVHSNKIVVGCDGETDGQDFAVRSAEIGATDTDFQNPSAQSFGRTPRGRLVPKPADFHVREDDRAESLVNGENVY